MSVREVIEQHSTALDNASILAVVGVLAGLLPPIAAFLTIVWTLVRLWESDTVQKLLGRKK